MNAVMTTAALPAAIHVRCFDSVRVERFSTKPLLSRMLSPLQRLLSPLMYFTLKTLSNS